MSGARKPWEGWEDDLVRQCERTEAAYAALAARLSRTPCAVTCRASLLRLDKAHRSVYSDDDRRAILDWYAQRKALDRAICARLGKTVEEVPLLLQAAYKALARRNGKAGKA